MASFKERCEIAQNCLPDAEYKKRLTILHNEMLAKIKKLEFHRENYSCMACWGEPAHCDCGMDKE